MAKFITMAMEEQAIKKMLREDMKFFKDDPTAFRFRMLVLSMRSYQQTYLPNEYTKILEGGTDLTLTNLED